MRYEISTRELVLLHTKQQIWIPVPLHYIVIRRLARGKRNYTQRAVISVNLTRFNIKFLKDAMDVQ
jgi:hypothetical protein